MERERADVRSRDVSELDECHREWKRPCDDEFEPAWLGGDVHVRRWLRSLDDSGTHVRANK